MPVERVDVNLPSGLPADVAAEVSQSRIDGQERVAEGEKEDAVRKAAEKKIAEKKETLKESGVQREVLQRQNDLEQKMQQVLGGAWGQDAARALSAWGDNRELQSKLTEAQKSLFREAMAQSPERATEAGRALDRLTRQPGFEKAVTSAQQMGTLQAGLLADPKATEGPAAQLLQSRFMQSSRADAQTKTHFLRFGLQQAARGRLDSVERTGDMLGTLAQQGIPRGAQRAAMRMAERSTGDAEATSNVERLVQHPDVRAMPTFARGKATELLAKANGKAEVREGFEQLASEPKFKAQTPEMRGRFFSTIGSGKASELRALTDHSLAALRSSELPSRSGQVGRFLGKMAAQVQRGGASSVDPGALLREARKAPLPAAPRLLATEGLDDEEAARARAQNRGQILHYFNQMQRLYEQGEKKLKGAKYLEDVNALQTLREPPPVDTSSLSPDELAIYEERSRSVADKRAQVLRLQQQRSRELRNKRMPPARRRAMLAERRAVGKQPRYFQPGVGRSSAAPAGAGGSATATVRASGALRAGASVTGHTAPVAGADVQSRVSAAVAQLGQGPITPERATQVARAIAQQVAQEVVQQVASQLLSGAAPAEAPAAPAATPRQTVKTDGWGVQRVFDRDLVGAPQTVVKPPLATAGSAPAAVEEKYTGKRLVKDDQGVRTLDDLLAGAPAWNELSKAEQVLLRNLGWSGQTWATRNAPAARWPIEMATAYMELSPAKREAVRRLGLSATRWDERVQALAMGKKA